MQIDYIEIGCTPTDESCAQVGKDDYYVQMRKETAEFIRMLNQLFPPPDDGVSGFRVKSFPHDFGAYHEVVAVYNADSTESAQWAFTAESQVPQVWDEQARKALGPAAK